MGGIDQLQMVAVYGIGNQSVYCWDGEGQLQPIINHEQIITQKYW